MNRKVLDTIEKYDMLGGNRNILCAVSGGADSMALIASLRELSGALSVTVSAAHLNHLIRGEEALRDERFVREYCEKNGIPFYCERVDVKKEAEHQKKGIEETARDVRYAFFERARLALSCDLVATAHTSNDNLETMLLNLMRGTGILGLCGIPPKRDRIIRPLIGVCRDEVEAYLREKGIDFVTDSSNLTDEYTRNEIRNDVIPKLIKIKPSVLRSAFVAADALRLDAGFIMSEAEKIAGSAKTEENGIAIDAELIASAHPAVSGRAVRLLFETPCRRKRRAYLVARREHPHALQRKPSVKKAVFALRSHGIKEISGACAVRKRKRRERNQGNSIAFGRQI